jgi:hypothetical protein
MSSKKIQYNGAEWRGSGLKPQFRPGYKAEAAKKVSDNIKVSTSGKKYTSYGKCTVCNERDITFEGSEVCTWCFKGQKEAERKMREEEKLARAHPCESGLDCGGTAYDMPDHVLHYCKGCNAALKAGDLRKCRGTQDNNYKCYCLTEGHGMCPGCYDLELHDCATEGCPNKTTKDWCKECTAAYKKERADDKVDRQQKRQQEIKERPLVRCETKGCKEMTQYRLCKGCKSAEDEHVVKDCHRCGCRHTGRCDTGTLLRLPEAPAKKLAQPVVQSETVYDEEEAAEEATGKRWGDMEDEE